MRRPIQVLVYPVRRMGDDWEYLLLHRLTSREAFWQGVTGAPERGETLADAARRELVEETQMTPLRLDQMDYWYLIPVADRWRHLYSPDVIHIKEYVFVAQVGDQDPVIDSHEHDAYQWCSFDQALALLLWPKNKAALKHCRVFLLQQSL